MKVCLYVWMLFVRAAVAVAIVCTNGCELKPTTTDSQDSITIRVGFRPRAMLDPTVIVAKRQGPGVTGVEIELVPISSPQDGLAKFAANEVDVLAGLPLEAVCAYVQDKSQRVPFKIYAFQADAAEIGWAAIVASKTTDAATVAELGNHSVASLPTDQGEYLLKKILLSAGVPESSIRTTRYSLANPLAGLASGEHDALFGPDPAIAIAVTEGYRVIERGTLSRYLANGKPFPVSASVISIKFLEAHPAEAAEFIEAMMRTAQIVTSDVATVRRYFTEPEFGGLSESVAAELVFPLNLPPNSELNEVTNVLLQDLYRDGLLRHPISIETLILE